MKKKQQQHLSGGGDPWPHGAPVGGALPCLGSCKRRIPLLPFLRFSLRDYGFCMATLLVFCLGSLFYQLSGGPPRFLLDLRQYLGKEGLRRPRKSWAPGERVISGKHLKLSRPPRSPRLPRWDANEHPSARQLGAPVFHCTPSCPQRRGAPGRCLKAGHHVPVPNRHSN